MAADGACKTGKGIPNRESNEAEPEVFKRGTPFLELAPSGSSEPACQETMADINSDSEDNSARVQQEWEVVSLSASGMSAASAPASLDDSVSPTASGMTETTSDLPGVTASMLHSQYCSAPYRLQPDEKVFPQENVADVAATDSVEPSSEGPKELGPDFTLGTESQFSQMFGKSWIDAISSRAISPGDSSITRDSLDISDFDLKAPGVETELGEDNPLVQSPNMSSSVATSAASVASDSVMDKSDGRPIDEEQRCVAEREGDTWARDFLASNQEEVQVAGGAEVEGEKEEHEQAKEEEEEEELATIRSSTPATSPVKEYSYEGWWKRKASFLLVQARQANSIWSLALAAAVMGVVLLGQRWHRERCQNQQLRLQLYSREDRISELLRQVKDLSERRRVHLIRSGSYGGLLN